MSQDASEGSFLAIVRGGIFIHEKRTCISSFLPVSDTVAFLPQGKVSTGIKRSEVQYRAAVPLQVRNKKVCSYATISQSTLQ
jgi:hypothetical protein